MRLRECPECNREVRALGSACRPELRIHFDAGTEQKDIALERREAEHIHDEVDRGWRRHGRGGLRDAPGMVEFRRPVALDKASDSREFGRQQLLVRVDPDGRLGGYVHDVTSITAPL